MASQLLDRAKVSIVDGFHEVPKVEQASLELVFMPDPNVLLIGLEGHTLPKRGVLIEQLDRAHNHVFDKFVCHEDNPA
jgi:hypothetical protein